MNPAEIRGAVLRWLYDRSRISPLPHLETGILQGLRREGTDIQMPQLQEALDFLTDKTFTVAVKPELGGGRQAWAWRITAAGKTAREEMP